MACISREDWGATGTVPLDSTNKDEIAIHHSVSANRSWTRAEEESHLRQINQMHINQGFSTIGYSYMVFPSGRCYIGRGRDGLPAGQSGQNTGTWAICMIGDFRTHEPSVDQRREVRRLIVLLRDEEGANHLGGHREYPNQSTVCPGDAAMEYVRKWRDDFNLTKPERT